VSRLLALLNTLLIAGALVAMIVGYTAIKKRDRREGVDRAGVVRRHKRAMITAFTLSALFLVSFVVRYVRYGRAEIPAPGALRVVYYVVWFTHEPIAVVSIPIVSAALVLALLGRFSTHRELARWALPLWIYAALTGNMLYLLLYVL
jgi:putative membrane protein